MEDRVLKMECMSITAILEEGRVAFELNGTLFLSFCSFKEEGNETNQKKREVSKSSLINLTSLCHIFEYSLHLSRLVLPVACHGEQVLVHKGWDFCLYFLCHLESGWPWRGSGVEARLGRRMHLHHVPCCATPLAGMDLCMQYIAYMYVCTQVLGAV